MKAITVSVTQEHIDAADRQTQARCPIALALRESTGEHALVYADGFQVRCDTLGARTGRLTRAAQEFVRDFDAGKPVKPSRFRFRY